MKKILEACLTDTKIIEFEYPGNQCRTENCSKNLIEKQNLITDLSEKVGALKRGNGIPKDNWVSSDLKNLQLIFLRIVSLLNFNCSNIYHDLTISYFIMRSDIRNYQFLY